MDKKNRFEGKKRVKLGDSFSLTYWKMFNIPLFGRGMTEVLKMVENWIDSKTRHKWIATVNPEFVMRAIDDDKFMNLLKKTDLNVVDGVGLIWAQQMLRPNSKFLIFNLKFLKAIKIGNKKRL